MDLYFQHISKHTYLRMNGYGYHLYANITSFQT